MALYIDLKEFAEATAGELAGSELLRRVDRRVASYYLALPLAGEDNRVTVATACPDNAAGLRVLEQLLQADIVPVASAEDDLLAAIARFYPEVAPGEGAVMAWTDDPAWADTVIETASAFGRAAGRPVVILDTTTALDDVLARATYDFSLLVARASGEAALERLVRRSPVSVLVVRGGYAPVHHVLVALRGFGSDHAALDRVLPLMAQEGAGVTVLPLSGRVAARLNGLPDGQSPALHHLRDFLRALDRDTLQVEVRLSQGDPASRIIAELAGGRHAMLVVAAEAEGEFVWQVLSRIEAEGAWPGRPVLVVKPPVRMTNDQLRTTGSEMNPELRSTRDD